MSNKSLDASFGNVELTVTPEKMFAAADSISKRINTMNQAFEKMIDLVKNTSSYWEGDASDQGRGLFENENDNFINLVSNLNNYVSELKALTSIYVTTEETLTEYAQTLPDNILF